MSCGDCEVTYDEVLGRYIPSDCQPDYGEECYCPVPEIPTHPNCVNFTEFITQDKRGCISSDAYPVWVKLDNAKRFVFHFESAAFSSARVTVGCNEWEIIVAYDPGWELGFEMDEPDIVLQTGIVQLAFPGDEVFRDFEFGQLIRVRTVACGKWRVIMRLV